MRLLQTDREARVSRHGTVDGILTQLHAVQRIGSVGSNRANHVGRINVLDGGNLVLSKVALHGFS
jgi:hypothetical protein